MKKRSTSRLFGADPGGDFLDSLIGSGELLERAPFMEKMRWGQPDLARALAAEEVFFLERRQVQYFPAWYADPRFNRRQLLAVTRLLKGLPSGSKLQFFLNPRGSLATRTPLQALLDGEFKQVMASAEGFAQG